MLRRTLYVVVDLVLSAYTTWKYTTFVILTFICLQVHLRFQPFDTVSE